MPADPIRPLLLTSDPDLLDDLLRLTAAASVDVTVAPDLVALRRQWSAASLVVIGAVDAAACARTRLPRRTGVVLVGRGDAADLGPTDSSVWQVARDLGAEHVVFLPAAEPWLIDRLAATVTGPDHSGRMIGVVGGRGGAGASILAAGLAVTSAKQGVPTLLLDIDPLGGGADLLLGRENSPGLRWPDLADAAGRVSAPELHAALPRLGDLSVLSWDRGDLLSIPPEAVAAALHAGRRGSGLVVADLPRRPDEAALTVLQTADLVLLVVPAEVRACAAAVRVAAAIGPHCAQLRCVVRGPSPAGLRAKDLAAALGLPLAGVLRSEHGLPVALEHGLIPAGNGRGPLAVLCRRILADLEPTAGAA